MVFAVALSYAVIRYNYFGQVSLESIPLYIFNKALSLTALISISISYIISPINTIFKKSYDLDRSKRKLYGEAGFTMAAFHILISNLITSPERYPKLYSESGNLNIDGEMSFLMGVMAFAGFLIPTILSLIARIKGEEFDWKKNKIYGEVALIFSFLHMIFLGIKGWFTIEKWHGSMPPITLLAAFVVLIPILFLIISKLKK